MNDEGSNGGPHRDRPARILLLSYYFPPERTPGAFRSSALLNALLEVDRNNRGPSIFVDVLTAQPNRYRTSTFRGAEQENGASYRVRRLPVGNSAASYLGQAADFAIFAARIRKAVKDEHYDLVFATTSRQMTGLLGAWIAARRNARFYLDFRDQFVLNLRDMFPWPLRPAASIARWLERWMLRRADRINVVSEGFLPYLRGRVAGDVRCFPNGIDDIFCGLLEDRANGRADRPREIVYAGNIGAGQELHRIIPQMAELLGTDVTFRIFGEGRGLGLLKAEIGRRRLANVVLNPPIAREALPDIYARADVLFLHLSGTASLEGVLPSKVFEYGASGKPIIAGVSGYAARFIHNEIANSAVFPPGDPNAAVEALSSLRLSNTDRSAFVQRFSREGIMRRMAEDIVALLDIKSH